VVEQLKKFVRDQQQELAGSKNRKLDKPPLKPNRAKINLIARPAI
jgi:hypothetical protein